MPEMEPGKAPESKRSRKPAHPVKREVNQEMKSFAESTMNELLGWYGYEKVELREAEGSEVGSCPVRGHRQHVSVLKENSVTKPKAVESRVLSSSLAVKNGERDACGVPVSSSSLSSFSASVKEQHSTHVIVPLIKPSAVEERQMQIVCVWCQKEGLKRYSLIMGSELKSFCSEKCFAACRRAYFKRNKAKGEDRHGDQSPTPGQTVDTPPRLVLKMSSNVRACDWCKHVHQTKEYLDFSSGEERLQFCSSKCLNRYKMDVFYREARAALTTSSAAGSSPGRGEEGDARAEVGEPARSGQMLLTPESWDGATTDGGHKGQTGKTRSACQSPPIINAGSSNSAPSAAKVVVPAPRPKERSGHPPPTESLFSAPPPHPVDYQHRPPPPPPIPPPFIRPPLQAQGLRSPTSGMPRNPAPPPPPSPTANPLFHHPTYPAPYLPYPPPYPHPLPHLGLGMPVFGPPCPQSTLLVPYPIIVPLPVPVPVPIPILLPPRDINPSSGPAGVVHHHDDREEEAEEESGSQTEETSETDIDTSLQRIKRERTLTPPVSSTHCPGRDLSPGMERESPILRGPMSEHRDGGRERQVIQRVVHGQAVKEETATQGGVHILGQRDAGTNPEEPEGQTSPLSSSHPTTQTSSSSLHTPLLSTHSSTANLSQTTVLLPTHTAAESKNTHSAIVLHQTSSHCTGSATCVVGPTVSTLLDNRTVTPSAPLSLDNLHANQATSLPFGNQSGATPPLDSGGEPSPKLDPPSDSSLSESEDGRENDCQETSQLDRTDSQTDQSNESGGGLEEDEMLAADEEHTYARIVLRKSQEADSDTQAKPAAYTHAASHARPHDTEKHDGDAEPAAKRRCLRIREQNK